MRSFTRKTLIPLLIIWDLANMILWFVISASIISREIDAISLTQFFALRIKVVNFILFLGFALCWYIIFLFFGLYYSRRFINWKGEIVDILNATSAGTIVLFAMGLVFGIKLAIPQFLFLFWLCTTASTIAIRLIIRFLMERLRLKGLNLHNIIIVGTNRRARAFAGKINSRPELGYHIVGFVDDEWEGTNDFKVSGYSLVSNFNDFAAYIRDHVVDEVIIDLPLNTFYAQASEIVARCVEQGIIVRFISDSFYLLRNMKLARSKMELFDDNVLISVYTGAMGGWPIVAKRIFDLVISLFLLGLLLPIFIIIAFLIKLTSPGPVFFRQKRVGLNKRRFCMYKFRTMISDAELKLAELEHLNEVTGPVFKIKNDPRVTPLGRILRKTSLDELPQLINVLQGDMSLVGPRPLPVRDYNGFSKDWQRRRFSVPPGITCLWQISGRSNTSFEEWMRLDMQYIDQWNFGLDLEILLRTIPAVLTQKGAS